MDGISLLFSGDSGFAFPSIEQTVVWAMFYAALFWLPVRGAAALIERRRQQIERGQEELSPEPCYHIGMQILPPL